MGNKNEHVFHHPEFDIEEVESFKLKITHKRSGMTRWTSYFNAVYWDLLEEVKEAPKEAKEPTTDGSGPSGSPRRRGAKA